MISTNRWLETEVNILATVTYLEKLSTCVTLFHTVRWNSLKFNRRVGGGSVREIKTKKRKKKVERMQSFDFQYWVTNKLQYRRNKKNRTRNILRDRISTAVSRTNSPNRNFYSSPGENIVFRFRIHSNKLRSLRKQNARTAWTGSVAFMKQQLKTLMSIRDTVGHSIIICLNSSLWRNELNSTTYAPITSRVILVPCTRLWPYADIST